ncbi:hypothetical protein N7470_000554 [Penicillium chermesinum]|nr:hypothetical protein N7470_000554 [Penicillium chermesinum]
MQPGPPCNEGREENTGPSVGACATGPPDDLGGWDVGHDPRRASDASDVDDAKDTGGDIAGDANSSRGHESPSPRPATPDPPEVIEIGSDTDHDASELFEEADLVNQEERLRQFQEALKIDQYTAERWAECRRFYQIAEDSNLGDRPSDLIPLRGLKRPLLPHQAFAVWWILHSETTTGTGGFEADDMGIGKTFIAQATVVVARWVMRATEAVQQARETSGATHLPATNVDPRRRCPSSGRNPYPICCPCEFGSPTSRLQPSCGLQLFMVPPKLMVHWVKEWTLNVDEQVVDLELLLGYSPSHAALRGVRYRFVSQLDDSQKAALQYREAQVWGHAAGLHRYTAATGERLRREQQAHLEDMRRNQPLARPGQDRYVILTTPKSFQTQVVEPLAVRFAQARPRQRGPKGGLRAPQPPVRYFFRDTTIWSRAFRDECHEEKGRQTNSLRALRGLRGPTRRVGPSTDPTDVAPTTTPPPVWFMSGTPFEASPGDLSGYLEVIERPQWTGDEQLRSCGSSALQQLGHDFRRAALPSREVTAIIDRFRQVLNRINYLSRKVSSRWQGQPIITLPPHRSIDINCPIPAPFLAQLQPLDRTTNADAQRFQGRRTPGSLAPAVLLGATLQRLRVFVTFPALYPIYQERSDLPLTIDRLSEQGWDVRPQESWFATHLARVVDPSPKLQALFRIIHGLGVDCGGREEKLVILSMYPVVALIVYLVRPLPPLPPLPAWMLTVVGPIGRPGGVSRTARFAGPLDDSEPPEPSRFVPGA